MQPAATITSVDLVAQSKADEVHWCGTAAPMELSPRVVDETLRSAARDCRCALGR